MKVLIVHTEYQCIGGEEMVVSQEVELLKSRGVTAEVLWFDNKKRTLLNLLLLPFNFFAYLKLRKKLKAFQPDVVHLHNLHFAASPAVIYAISKSAIPCVMTLHNYRMVCPSGMLYSGGSVFLDSLRSRFPWTAIRKGVYKNPLVTFWLALSMQLHQWLNTWKRVNKIIVLTENARKILLESSLGLKPDQLVVKPNFTSPLGRTSAERSESFLYVGRLSEEKGIDVLLKAFALVNFKLTIAGDGPLINSVHEAAAASPNIQYLGKQPKAEIGALMNKCTALVFPSVWYEGMPLTIIEALSCGTPVLASRLGAMENMITDNLDGLHFLPNDVTDLAATLQDWMNLPEARKDEYRKQARITFEENYTSEKNADQLFAIYRSVTNAFEFKRGEPAPVLSQSKDRLNPRIVKQQ